MVLKLLCPQKSLDQVGIKITVKLVRRVTEYVQSWELSENESEGFPEGYDPAEDWGPNGPPEDNWEEESGVDGGRV